MFSRSKISAFPYSFWLLNLSQMVERLAYWITLLQMPVYIAQKDATGGLGWDHSTKGIIFFVWALFQNLTPIFAGAFADKYGRRRTFYISLALIVAGYLLLATQRNFTGFLTGAILLGIGSGVYKPALLGSLAMKMNSRNSSLGWGLNAALVNLAVFAGPPLAIALEKVSQNFIFFAAAGISLINAFIFLALDKDEYNQKPKCLSIKRILEGLFRKDIIYFILPMCGFAIIYMQFYETLPNFIYDWIDTSEIAKALPSFMSAETPKGTELSYKWLYNINSGLIIVFVAIIAYFLRKKHPIKSIIAGMILATGGLFLSGYTYSGILLMAGIVIYSFGEMIVNPKFNDYMAAMAPKEEISMYMSYTSISWAVGLGAGSLAGGYLYDKWGEKASLAAKYLAEKHGIEASSNNAMQKFIEISGMSQKEAANYLWDIYEPWKLWIIFAAVGAASIGGLIIYYKKRLGNYQNQTYS